MCIRNGDGLFFHSVCECEMKLEFRLKGIKTSEQLKHRILNMWAMETEALPIFRESQSSRGNK